jgi:hypothetical protein
MRSKRESFYDEDAHLTKRGVKVLAPLSDLFDRILRKATTPRECMELRQAVQDHLSLSVTIRTLNLQGISVPSRKGRRGRGR